MNFFKNIPVINLQALIALGCFGLSLFFARMVRLISEGKIPGTGTTILILRTMIGFLFAASIALGMGSFAGIDMLHNLR